ncbi:MAG: LytTR family DNA-binding domain-containing protein [Bacteroidota bacterium]
MKRKITAIILDDESNPLEYMVRTLSNNEEIELLGQYMSMSEAEREIIRLKPEILFLDIRVNGFYVYDMIERLKYHNIQSTIIFVSAFIEEQIENMVKEIGYNSFPFGYIRKPMTQEKLQNQLEQYHLNVSQSTVSADLESIIIRNMKGKSYTRYRLENILYFKADDRYSRVYLMENKKIVGKLTSTTLNDWDDKLPDALFFKISKSHIVNMDYFRTVTKKKYNWECHLEVEGVLLESPHIITIPEKKWAAFKNRIGL